MIHIFYTSFSNQMSSQCYDDCLSRLPLTSQAQNRKYYKWEDRVRHLLGKMLLIKGFNVFGLNHEHLQNIKYSAYGRPFISNTIDFNISHSGQYVICAISAETKVGIDIEQISPVDFGDFSNTMSIEEWDVIRRSDDSHREFFRLWTMKESVMKADGRGLSIPIANIFIKNGCSILENKTWFLTELPVDSKHVSYLASEVDEKRVSMKYFNWVDSYATTAEAF